MIINDKNHNIGNRAMAAVLLLYYHLIKEGGFTNDQTVYIDPKDFDGFSFLNVDVVEEKFSVEVDEGLLREGAIIFLLCDLNDQIAEYEDDYLSQDLTKNIILAYKEGKLSTIPEVADLFNIINVPESELNYKAYRESLSCIYKKYVLGRFKSMVGESKP